ncbi:hypothetical protein VNO77_05693 [Canavalia gladiata]|uniref:Uncharacterized protein n=1 Tax=Canavalia gladiata TaxID=3824 RepID=A0AAN9N425_CANGL
MSLNIAFQAKDKFVYDLDTCFEIFSIRSSASCPKMDKSNSLIYASTNPLNRVVKTLFSSLSSSIHSKRPQLPNSNLTNVTKITSHTHPSNLGISGTSSQDFFSFQYEEKHLQSATTLRLRPNVVLSVLLLFPTTLCSSPGQHEVTFLLPHSHNSLSLLIRFLGVNEKEF